MDFRPVGPRAAKAQLEALRLASVEELFERQIPTEARLDRSLNLPPPLSEQELVFQFEQLAATNKGSELSCFAGAGAYDRFIPSVVSELASRSEFYTSYTQYQAEASQGFLQVLFEYQSLLARLTGMEIANSSLYDGASALAEALLMAHSVTGRRKFVLPDSLHPLWRQVAGTYLAGLDAELVSLSWDERGRLVAPEERLLEGAAAVVVQSPNFFGVIEDPTALVEAAHKTGALAICVFEPVSLARLKPPGDFGFDIAVGEGQSLGLPLGFGGPYLGLFTCRKEHVRQMPGRVVGRTVDSEDRTAYCLTLQTREQHIRREKATSNICTNQALCALQAGLYLAAVGSTGLRQVARESYERAHQLEIQLETIPGIKKVFPGPFFAEFLVSLPIKAAAFIDRMTERGILAGVAPSVVGSYPEDWLLVAVTEKRGAEDLEHYIQSAREVLADA